jgi:hypothetical protein
MFANFSPTVFLLLGGSYFDFIRDIAVARDRNSFGFDAAFIV